MSNIIITAPTKEVELPITKAKVKFKEWLTKDESDAVREPMRRHEIELLSQGKENKSVVQRFTGEIMREIEHLTIEKAVVEITVGEETHKEGLLAICKQFPESDYDFLKEQIDNSLAPPKDQKA